jgi:uncharacterized radical SAM protein YgiQ
VLDEAGRLVERDWFRGSISDVGGPTANMYGAACGDAKSAGRCRRGSCLWPSICKHLVADGRQAEELLRRVRGMKGVKHVAVSSGIRFDLLERQPGYFRELVAHHVGGLLKVAPEHTSERVLSLMHKPGGQAFERFIDRFRQESGRLGKRQSIVPYLMSGHPGCTLGDMVDLALFLRRNRLKVEQVQEFTPTPGSLATCMYHTGMNPFTGESVHVARSDREKILQKSLLLWHLPAERNHVLAALRTAGRTGASVELLGEKGKSGTPGR